MDNKILQIRLTNDEVRTVNELGHGSVPKHVCKLDLSCKENATEIAKNALEKGYYSLVAKIEADDLEQVFEYGNIGPESKIERLGSMASISVGDIVVNPTGTWLCARIGWKKVELV
jgi:hypothetical protein